MLGDKLENIREFLINVERNVDTLVSILAIQSDAFSSTRDVQLREQYGNPATQ